MTKKFLFQFFCTSKHNNTGQSFFFLLVYLAGCQRGNMIVSNLTQMRKSIDLVLVVVARDTDADID
jgi:hypothetical protein